MKMFARLALLFGLLFAPNAEAASRFWVPLVVSGAISGTGGLCRLTVNDSANLTAGNAVIVAAITGATACNGTTTVTTVVDSTHIEINLAFGVAYVSGGTVAGGQWTATGVGNWSTSSGGAGGASVPGSADAVTFNANSGGGTVIVNLGGALTIQSIDLGAFTGTWDNSVNNNNFTLNTGGLLNSGSGTRTIRLGTATYNITGVNGLYNFQTTTGLTFVGGSSFIVFSSSTGNRTFDGGSISHGNVTFGSTTGSGVFTLAGSNTFASWIISAPNYVQLPNGGTSTVTAPFTWAGSSSAQAYVFSTTVSSHTIATAAGSTASWFAFHGVIFTGAPVATNSFDLNNNTGITITAPSGGGGHIIGGWLLWSDLPNHANDNTPAWLEKAA